MTSYMKLKVTSAFIFSPADTVLAMFEVVPIFTPMHLWPELKAFEQYFHVVLFVMHSDT